MSKRKLSFLIIDIAIGIALIFVNLQIFLIYIFADIMIAICWYGNDIIKLINELNIINDAKTNAILKKLKLNNKEKDKLLLNIKKQLTDKNEWEQHRESVVESLTKI